MLQPFPIESLLRLGAKNAASALTAGMVPTAPTTSSINPTLDEAFGSFAETAANLERAYASLRGDVVRLRSELTNERETRLRNEAMAEVAAVLAHEIRNPLGSLEIFATLLEEAPELSGRSRQQIRQMQAGLRSLASTVSTVLAFYHPAEPQLCRLALKDLVDWAAKFLSPLTDRAQLRFCTTASSTPLVMLGDRTQMEQLLLNLVLNSCQHCAAGDVLSIAAAPLAGSAKQVELTVTDTGCGISEANLAKVFEPGFTSKAQGTGLGLAVVRRIVEQHQGLVRIASRPQQGTVVSMVFPLAESPETLSIEEWSDGMMQNRPWMEAGKSQAAEVHA